MEPQFWIKAWQEGRTNFHRDNYHEKLTEYFPRLKPQKGQKVLVPLCGKTKYLLIAYEYDPSQMEGPPFSVGQEEIRSLYESHFTIELMENKKPSNEGPRLAAVESLRQQVYILTGRS